MPDRHFSALSAAAIGIGRIPRRAGYLEARRDILQLVARRVPSLHSQAINKWFKSRSWLAFALPYMVIFEIFVVETTHPRFDVPCVGIHRHHPCLKKVL